MFSNSSEKRECYLSMVKILDQANVHENMIDFMKRAIGLNPELNAEERNLLSVTYKNVISVRRNGIRVLNVLISQEDPSNIERINQLNKFKKTLISELEKYCYDLIKLVDDKLLPVATDAEAKLFYEKLKADYIRYISETKEGNEKEELAEKANKYYENALAIGKDDIQHYKPSYLGLILNYSVFLFEILDQKKQAIELADLTYNEYITQVDQNSEGSSSEANSILQLLKDNVSLWSSQMNEEE